jgi:hypothetical protein
LIGGTILDRRTAIKARSGAAPTRKSKSVQQVAGAQGRPVGPPMGVRPSTFAGVGAAAAIGDTGARTLRPAAAIRCPIFVEAYVINPCFS